MYRKNCPICGMPILDEDGVCPFCGRKISHILDYDNFTSNESSSSEDGVPSSSLNKKSRFLLGILIIAVLLAVVAIVLAIKQ